MRLLTKGILVSPSSSMATPSSVSPPPPPHSTPTSNVGRKSPRELDCYLMKETTEYEPTVMKVKLDAAAAADGSATSTASPPPPRVAARSRSRKLVQQQQQHVGDEHVIRNKSTISPASAPPRTTEEAVSRIMVAIQEKNRQRNNQADAANSNSNSRMAAAAAARASLLRLSRQVSCAERSSATGSNKAFVTAKQSSSSCRRENSIKLHIYDLLTTETYVQLGWGCEFPIGQCFQSMNDGLHALGTGAYHCGIEVNGIEYAYGANNSEGTTGVFSCIPKHSPGFEYRTTLDFGSRPLIQRAWVRVADNKGNNSKNSSDTPQSTSSSMYREVINYVDGRDVVREMAKEYLGPDYDLLRRNCCTFARDASLRLGISEEEIPTWFMNLADAGAATQDVAAMTLKPITSMLSGMEDDDDDSIIDVSRSEEESPGETGFEVIAKPCKKKKGRSLHKMEIVSVVDALEIENMQRVGAEPFPRGSRRRPQVQVRRTSSWAY